MRVFCETPDTAKDRRFSFLIALSLFVVVTGIFYHSFWMDLNGYLSADWDESASFHAAALMAVKYFHQFPLWDPYLCGGSSLIGNPQNPSPISLTFLFSWLLGPLVGIKIGVMVNIIIGMIGMYVLLGYYNAAWIARVFAAVVLSLSGACVNHIVEGNFMWSMAMYWPWMLLFFLKAGHSRSWAYLAGFMLSLQFWGGAPYQVAFAVGMVFLLTVFLCIQDRKAAWFLRFAEMMAAFVVFSAPKMFAVMEMIYRFPRVTAGEDAQVPWSVFYYAFLCRDQIHSHIDGIRVGEYSAYVGVIPVILAGILFFQWKKFWPYLAVLFISLVMAMGNAPWSPVWLFFHVLGGGLFHFSTRAFLMSVFFIAFGSGLSLSFLIMRWKDRYPAVALISFIVTFVVITDLLLVLMPIHKIWITNARSEQVFHSTAAFGQIQVPHQQRYRFGNSSMLDLILRNVGTVNGYDPLPITQHVRPANLPGYRGEFYLQDGFGMLEVVSWSPNKWIVNVSATREDVLVVNQNFDPGWRTDPPRKVLNMGGVLGVGVTPKDDRIIFYYLPFSVVLGLWVSLLGSIAIGWDVFVFHRRKAVP